MDANKLNVLREIEYNMKACCFCVHGNFSSNEVAFGTCGLHVYSHMKHNDDIRELSIHRSGHCVDFVVDEMKLGQIHGFAEFTR